MVHCPCHYTLPFLPHLYVHIKKHTTEFTVSLSKEKSNRFFSGRVSSEHKKNYIGSKILNFQKTRRAVKENVLNGKSRIEKSR